MENEEIGKYDLSKAWEQVESNLVQSTNLDPEPIQEMDDEEAPQFDYKVAHKKLDSIFTNIGKSAQSAEFGGNDVWLISGNYPITNPGDSAIMLYAEDDVYRYNSDSYNIFKRTVTDSGEYEDEEIGTGTFEQMLVKAQSMKPMRETDNIEDSLPLGVDERLPAPTNVSKTVKLDGPLADELVMQMQKNGETEWTDGFQGSGPYLPLNVEQYILDTVGNDTEEPFTVSFIKYGTAHPQEPRGVPIYVQYDQGTPEDPNKFRR